MIAFIFLFIFYFLINNSFIERGIVSWQIVDKYVEVFSRVVGYHRPISNWNKGKEEEFKDRKVFLENDCKCNSKFS